jgi:hypothetical protein
MRQEQENDQRNVNSKWMKINNLDDEMLPDQSEHLRQRAFKKSLQATVGNGSG